MQLLLSINNKITKNRVFPALRELSQSESKYKNQALKSSMKERGTGSIIGEGDQGDERKLPEEVMYELQPPILSEWKKTSMARLHT